MTRRSVVGTALALLLVLAAPAAADLVKRKQTVDAQIAQLQGRVARARAREDALRAQIDGASAQIRGLERQAGDVSIRLAPLEHELVLRELKLNRLDALFQLETDRLAFLRREYAIASKRLGDRLVALYEAGAPDTLDLVLSARSFNDLLDAIDYAHQIAVRDKRIADVVGAAKVEVREALGRTRRARVSVKAEAAVVAVRVHQVRELRDRLVASKQQLVDVQAQKRQSLASLTASERNDASEIDALAAVSGELAAKIRFAQSGQTASAAPPAGGFIWPVHGPVTSPFGWRWGRMHEGVDLGVGYGTPIEAAAAGTVIYAGWLGGYGNLTVIDHGGGLSTAYGHQERIVVSQGDQVTQGQVIGYVGCTGHCFGPHLHFEIRVNGQAVDPLGYL